MANYFKRFRVSVICGMFIYSLIGTVSAWGSDILLIPSIRVSEEYTDNVDVIGPVKHADFITRIAPGLELKYKSPLWDWDIRYLFVYNLYARDNTYNGVHNLLWADGNVRIIDDFFFLKLHDSYARVSTDGSTTDGNTTNQYDSNRLKVSPYFLFHPSPKTQLKVGYEYNRRDYSNVNVLSSTPFTSSQEHVGFIQADYYLKHNLSVFANVTYSNVIPSKGDDYYRLSPSLGIQHYLSEDLSYGVAGGYSWFYYSGGETATAPYFSGNITHKTDMSTASIKADVIFNSDPRLNSSQQMDVTGKLERKFSRSSIGMTALYSEIQNNLTNDVFLRRYGLGANGTYEFTNKVSGQLNLLADRFQQNEDDEFSKFYNYGYPYRLLAGAGFRYSMANDLSMGLNYSYTVYGDSLGSASDGAKVNRVIFDISKTFQGFSF